MKKHLKGILIAVCILALLLLCSPLLIGIMFAVTSRLHYDSLEPHRAATLRVPDSDIVVTLFRKQRPRAISYEGEYRILEVAQSAQANLYFELEPGYMPDLKAYWLPDTRCLKLVDSEKGAPPTITLIDLNAGTITDYRQQEAAELLASEPREASLEMKFPAFGHTWSGQYTESSFALPEDGVLVGTLEQSSK